MAKSYYDSPIWVKFQSHVQENKEKRKLKGFYSPDEPPEVIADEILFNDTYQDGTPINYTEEECHFVSQQWVYDLFGEDWQIVHSLLTVKEPDIAVYNECLYYRASYISNVLDILTVLAKTHIVNMLRPIPIVSKQSKPIYSSKDLMTILDVGESTLRKYRDNCLLEFSRKGDKIWYTEKHLMDFLNKTNINNVNLYG